MRIFLFIILIYNHGQSQGQGSSNLYCVDFFSKMTDMKIIHRTLKKRKWYGQSIQQTQEVLVMVNQHEIYNTELGQASILPVSPDEIRTPERN